MQKIVYWWTWRWWATAVFSLWWLPPEVMAFSWVPIILSLASAYFIFVNEETE